MRRDKKSENEPQSQSKMTKQGSFKFASQEFFLKVNFSEGCFKMSIPENPKRCEICFSAMVTSSTTVNVLLTTDESRSIYLVVCPAIRQELFQIPLIRLSKR